MMHGKKRGGSVIRVDYLRSQPKRDLPPPDTVNSSYGPKRQQQASNVLVISYPPVVHIDEQMLHNAMILFGEIDNIRSFPSRHYSLVEFRSVEEAQLAKDGLQGRLFNDPRISIMYELHPRPFDPINPGTWDTREPKRLRTEGNIPLRDMKDYIWRGIIAKGGTPVCHARCLPIRDWLGYQMPKVVNCSARTGLDMLAKHTTDAIGFDIVFFLPDSEEDFGSYTEFVRYLGDRNRAGVAKFDDGTTLFLVPPSDFLSKVLNVCGPERLYGVVLKFPQNDYMMAAGSSSKEKVDYSHEDSKSPQAQAEAGFSLTPELIATLASLAKGKFNPPNTEPKPSSFIAHQGQDVNFSMPQGQSGHFAYVPSYPHGFEQKPDTLSQPQSMMGDYVYQAHNEQQQQQAVNDFDADKNERYQSTLQFATNLLLKIHQQPPGQGSLH